MALLKNNIEVWTVENNHLRRLKEAEQTKTITQALMEKGVSKADVLMYYEDVDLGAFNNY